MTVCILNKKRKATIIIFLILYKLLYCQVQNVEFFDAFGLKKIMKGVKHAMDLHKYLDNDTNKILVYCSVTNHYELFSRNLTQLYELRNEKSSLWGFSTRSDTNWPV